MENYLIHLPASLQKKGGEASKKIRARKMKAETKPEPNNHRKEYYQ